MISIVTSSRVSVGIVRHGGIMRLPKFWPDKQQYNNAKPFPVFIFEIEEVETITNVSNMVHEPGVST